MTHAVAHAFTCINCAAALPADAPRVCYCAHQRDVGPFCAPCAAALDAAQRIASRWGDHTSSGALGRLALAEVQP